MITDKSICFLLALRFVLVTPNNASTIYNDTFVGDVWSSMEIKEKNGTQVNLTLHDALKLDGMKPEGEVIKNKVTKPHLKKSEKTELEVVETDKTKLKRLDQDKIKSEGKELKITEPENIEQDKMETKVIETNKTEEMELDNMEAERFHPDKVEQERIELKLTEPGSIEADEIESTALEQDSNGSEGIELHKMEQDGIMPEKTEQKGSGKSESEPMKPFKLDSNESGTEDKIPKKENSFKKDHNNSNNVTKDWLIISGRKASMDDFPFQAAVSTLVHEPDGWSICGGSIVTDRHILTAAHCVTEEDDIKPVTVGYIKISVGSRCLYNSHIKLNAARIFIHRCYRAKIPLVSDLAVVKTKERIKFSKSIFFIKIPTLRDRHVLLRGQNREAMCAVAGWGWTSKDGERSNELLFITPHLITINECQQKIVDININADIHLCAYKHGITTCIGDSGGGLVCNLTGIRKVYGVVSFGVCENFPTVYTRVDSHYKFVQDSINGVGGHEWVTGPLFVWALAVTALRV